MHTDHVLSGSTTVGAPPADVVRLIGDPLAMPRWAPGFADTARPAGGGRWTIASGGQEFEIRVVASEEAGTVDFLAPGEDRGLFARVVPSGEGAAVTFMLVVPAATPAEVIERERGTLERELAAVRDLCEAAPPDDRSPATQERAS
jgi:hypothetical protein